VLWQGGPEVRHIGRVDESRKPAPLDRQIIDLLVGQVNLNLVSKEVKIRLAPEASRYILEKTCADRSYGARPLRRALQKYIEDPLSDALIQGTLPRPGELEVYLGDAGIYCRQVKQEQPVAAGVVEESSPEEPAASIPLYMF
jgi:ATP-dependent Clp protease ATP-binding subunit ClpC